jgi:hypothetical protein
LTLSAESEVAGEAATEWRHAFDADGSGEVSADELGVGTSAIEFAAGRPEVGIVDVYFRIQAIENQSSTLEFTADGRANLSAFVVSMAQLFRFGALLDGVNATMDRIALTFENLAGRAPVNSSIVAIEDVSFSWSGTPAPGSDHTLELVTPPFIPLQFEVAGAFQISTWVGLQDASIDSGRSTLAGRPAGSSLSVTVSERPVSANAQLFVLGAVAVAAGAAAVTSLYFSKRHVVQDKPLPVVPKYK